MKWLQNTTAMLVSWAVFIGCGLWALKEGGYEPWIGVIAGFGGIVANLPTFTKPLRVTPEQKIAARDKWRPVFENYFLDLARDNRRTDCIVHDVGRLDTYPESGKEKGISSWFRVGLMGTYHRGVLLGLRWTTVEEINGQWVENQKEKTEAAIKVMLIAEVPYEAIESVNFDGDPYYNKPHLYCHFDYKGSPYERLYYGEEWQLDPGFPHHYREIAEYRPRPRWRFWRRS